VSNNRIAPACGYDSTATVGNVRRFTFATGNARKMAALPLYCLGAFANLFVPRSSRLWVFGSGIGVGEGALALLRHVRSVDPSIRAVWMARNDRDLADARTLGIRAVRRDSWRGFRLTLRAGVIVVTHGFGDANRYGTFGGFVVQLWHGIPFKYIHLDSPATTRIPLISRLPFVSSALRRAYARSANGYRMFVAASPLAGARFQTAFALPADRIAVTGDPRDDVLLEGSDPQRRAGAKARLSILLDEPRVLVSPVLLYAPTWRDGDPDPAVPTPAEWSRIVDHLERTDSLLVVRSHHLGVGDYSAGGAFSDRIHMLGAELEGDVTPLLPAFDTVITDYSSIAFDFALTNGTIIFLAPDVADYATTRGLYEPYAEFSGGTEVASWAAVIDLLNLIGRDPAAATRFVAHSRWLAERVHTFRDGGNTARVYAEIIRRVADYPTGAAPALPSKLPALRVDSVSVSTGISPELVASGPLGGFTPRSAILAGARLSLAAPVTVAGDGWELRMPLLTSRWGGPPLPPPSGRYRLRLSDAGGRRIRIQPTAAPIESALHEGLFRVATTSTADSLTIEFGAPLSESERGRAHQTKLERRYRSVRRATSNAVFFESYFGQNASCNPRGIDAALSVLRPDVARFWSVSDASVEVPPGAVAVIEGSSQWWAARASARVLIVNDWLRKRYRKRRNQVVMQTWHGTPLKKIALDRAGVGARTAVATYREKSRWDIMLAQNQFSSDTFRSAYAFGQPIWQEGYPRDDMLVAADPGEIRRRLGIPNDVQVVLYAPTWRDDRPGKTDHLDVASFSRELGPGFVTLIRGHSRTMRPGADVLAAGVIDVTSYPDISELFLVADALVTDYSSVMFDFTVTGKPLYFFAPDLEHYRDQLRGFYFDLLPVAPGPVLDDAAELIRYLHSPADHVEDYADRYSAWQHRFNPRDDGGAGERVVRRLVAEGFLD
jgi:CDP-glycerol glycerophosphotransferase